MKLSHARLETARRDPAAFSGGEAGPGGFRLSKTRVLHLAVYEFHRQGDDLVTASRYLREVYDRNFKTAADFGRLDDQLAEYAAAYRSGGSLTIEYRMRVSIQLGSGVELVGEVPRLDMHPSGGYALWLFGKQPGPWRNELRMPLLQAGCAGRMGVRRSQVTVGFYFFETGEYDREQFTEAAISGAREEAASLAAVLTGMMVNS